jgi:predicted nucleic acid-binding protein
MATPSAAFVDSSVLVRHLTDDPPAMAQRAAAILDGDEPLILCETILLESAYVLESVYEIERGKIVDVLSELIQKANLALLDLPKARALEALSLCRPSRRVSFTDAILWATARERALATIYTFDRKFPSQGISISA